MATGTHRRSGEVRPEGPPSRGYHVRANGVRLHVLEYAGDGPPLLLIPGITSPAITWGFVGERLAAANHVYILDNRGRGLSDARPGLGYALDDYANDAFGVIEALGLSKPVVLGHSMGGRIAARMGGRGADRLSRVVLADPPISGPGRKPYTTPVDYYLKAIEEAGGYVDFTEFRKRYPDWSDDHVALRLEWLPTCSAEAVAETHANFQREDIYPDFPGIACPTLLVYAGKAGVISDREAADIVARLPDGRAVRVETGHMIPFDDLDAFMAAVTEFVAAAPKPYNLRA